MKKLLAVAVACGLVFSPFGMMAEASSVNELRDGLVGIGVPSELANNLVNYLQTIDLNEDDAEKVENKLEEAFELVADVDDLYTLTDATKNKLVSLGNEAAGVLGLTLKYDYINGYETLTVVTSKGENLGSLRSIDIRELLLNFGEIVDSEDNVLEDLADLIVDVVQDGTGEFKPSPDDDLTDSGFGVGGMALAGVALMGAGASMAVVNKRKQK